MSIDDRDPLMSTWAAVLARSVGWAPPAQSGEPKPGDKTSHHCCRNASISRATSSGRS
jgi:hypothetical protein